MRKLLDIIAAICLASISKIKGVSHLCRQPAILLQQSHYLIFSCLTEVNPKSVVVCVWTFDTNVHGQQRRDNPSRLCKYKSACLELDVNALI